jgi:hypothetical protein
MQFVLTGFTHALGSRVFTFDRIAEDRSRTPFVIRADLDLIRKHDIRVQELPLLCRSFLERRDETDEIRELTFTEEEMSLCAQAQREAAALRKKAPRRPVIENRGAAWRTPQPLP